MTDRNIGISFNNKKLDIKQASSNLFVDQFDLKKEFKKGNVPPFIHESALYFFNHEMASVKNVKIKDAELFQDVRVIASALLLLSR